MTDRTTARPRLTNVQQLRGLAAGVVMLAHVLQSAGKRAFDDDRFLINGTIGVDIFFVISGFIMVGVTHEAFGSVAATKDFLIKRIARVVPAYWIWTTVIALLAFAAGSGPSWQKALASYTFFPLLDDGKDRPILGVGWTLNLEMTFYVLFAACLMLPRRVGLALLCTALIALPLLSLLGPSGAFAAWTSPIVLEFLIGVVIGLVYRSVRVPRTVPFLPLVLVVLVVWCVLTSDSTGGAWRPAEWAAAGLTVLLAVCLPQTEARTPLARGLLMLGDASYSLYLIHIVVLLVAAKVFDSVFGHHLHPAVAALYVLTIIAVSIGAAILSYRHFERRGELWVKAFLRGVFGAHPTAPRAAGSITSGSV